MSDGLHPLGGLLQSQYSPLPRPRLSQKQVQKMDNVKRTSEDASISKHVCRAKYIARDISCNVNTIGLDNDDTEVGGLNEPEGSSSHGTDDLEREK